jgi:hypothetical protein
MSDKKEKSSYKKIRQVWEINSKERIKEDKKSPASSCDECGLYLTDPRMCINCYEEMS